MRGGVFSAEGSSIDLGANEVESLDFKRPSWERAAEMARWLHRRGVLTKLRHSAGQDVDGGCGQLRARSLSVVNVVSSGNG